MSEQTSRDEAVRVGAEALANDYYQPDRKKLAAAVLDAARKAGAISYQDEWVKVEPSESRLTRIGDFLASGGYSVLGIRNKPELFVRRVSFEAGEEVNEEQG